MNKSNCYAEYPLYWHDICLSYHIFDMNLSRWTSAEYSQKGALSYRYRGARLTSEIYSYTTRFTIQGA